MLVNKVFSQNRVRQRLVPSRSSTSLLVDVSWVFSQDRYRGVRTRSLPFPLLVQAFKISHQDSVHPLLRTPVFMKTQVSLVKVFFDTTSALGVGTASALVPNAVSL